MISWSDETMKAISKVRLIFGSISMSVVLTAGFLGLATPAIAPSKAEAQALMLRQYANATVLTDKQLVGLLSTVGFKGESLKVAWAVAKKESHGRPLAYNGNRRTGDNSFGLFQVNMIGSMGADRRSQFGLDSNAELLNPVVNAQVAYHMSKGGKDWSAWKGSHQAVVQEWLKKYPYKATTTKAHKHKAKAISKAIPKAIHRAKHKAISKGKHK
jgi:hypothetical protein